MPTKKITARKRVNLALRITRPTFHIPKKGPTLFSRRSMRDRRNARAVGLIV
jgi:hypothetical protein